MCDEKYTFEKSQIIQGDCLEKIKMLPSNSIHFVCADLPYYKSCTPKMKDWVSAMNFCGKNVTEKDYLNLKTYI